MSEIPGSLSASRRAQEIRALTESPEVDLVVIGGGITGVGVALDAVTRGLSVVLVERDDLASGTSGASSRVIHGGTRYLAGGGVGLAVESSAERTLLMQRIAPHLVRAMPMLVPELPDTSKRTRRLTRLGFHAGDLVRRVTGLRSAVLPPPRQVSAAEAEGLFPGLSREGLSGAVLSFDAQLEDDARLVIAVARTAAEHGATILTRVEARAIQDGQVHCVDHLTGDPLTIRANHVVNAAGVWASELEPALRLGYRKGVHLLVPAATLGRPRTALAVPISPRPDDVVFAIPQSDDLVLVGATDTEATSPDDIAVSDDDLRGLLGTINRALAVDLTIEDVVGRYAGVRPILAGDKHGDLEKRHAVVVSDAGSVTVLGGKLTTYRRMAEDAVDRLISANMLWAGECQTRDLPLVGAASLRRLSALGMDQRLIHRYGIEAHEVMALAASRPELRERVVPHLPVLRAELVWALEHELAITAEDLIDRRTRIGQTVYREPALEVARRLVDITVRS
ncbi:glycerol-3-phosphate dehydrogenase/oxidase [Blastococcus sp. Marseille-P5729]|uniref:glycerol-3-phosphate dehydrogenase/oxidase n=1 Tax=Blastococcus sp. Marseille-P5729 TaxID=2086582 RepID=UPI000D10DBA8|nr:glycerol-3-phosphate dehydrogenase/oxidase [Blastococcus sp. Marseille-P5729]